MNYIKIDFTHANYQITNIKLIPFESRERARDARRRSGRVDELAGACALSECLLESRKIARMVLCAVVSAPAPVVVPGGRSLCLCLSSTLSTGLTAGARHGASVLKAIAIAVAFSARARPGAEPRPGT